MTPAGRYMAPPRPYRLEEFAKARLLLERALPMLAPQDWAVRIDLGDGKLILIVARCGGAAMSEDDGRTPVDCTLTTNPRVLNLILLREFLPRRALTGNLITVKGDERIATKFCDALWGRRVTNKIRTVSPLPSPTTDWTQAKKSLEEFGYAIVKDAMAPDLLERVRRRLSEQAEAERELGIACLEGGESGSPVQPNQRVWNLINKGAEFLELLDHPIIDAFVPDHLGDYFLLSNFTANIAGPGGRPMYPHNDQTHVAVEFPVCLNVFWFLDEVTAENGGTLVLPGSHRPEIGAENLYSIEEMTPVEGPAGSALLLDARVWHATGPNITSNTQRPVIICLFGRWWERQVDNMTLSVSDEVLATLSERIKTMLGFRETNTRGTVEGQPIGRDGFIIERNYKRLGALRPSRMLTK